ncbi:transcription termination factor NusA [Cellulosilyticum lentocellum]|uniref:Transcription termination/antitermination protein NusA n=1 Tax=Cellulosilyticum lentocellum (strain ATCC 49066 / DSM 5427 / NCIMB 11756 / RHM5) TaxID=642492 RepID=F2JGN1_CELLD|nr:transcription termination factor NusA [Cellulosilyticum lentocellum]ADZ84123.1 NusA antitermination factor [Cellulosilyticum lentocellum DSM 5427]
MNQEFIMAIDQIAKSKGINKEKLIDAIKQSIEVACKKHFGISTNGKQNIKINIDEKTGDVKVFAAKTVVPDEEVTNELLEVGITEAQNLNRLVQLDDIIDIEITPRNFGRIAAQNAKQVVIQKIKEAERQMVYEEYSVKLNDIVKGKVLRREKNGYIVQLDFTEASLPSTEAMPNDNFDEQMEMNDGIGTYKAFYLLNVKDFNKNENKLDGKSKNAGAQVIVSRTHPELVKRLFEQEVVEIKDGTVVIKSIAREAGSRTKIAVYSNDPLVDPVGACVGEKGKRINNIVQELNGEKIDVVHWSEDPKEFIREALSPAKVIDVELEETEGERNAKVIVPSHILTLAIGKGGQNVRLAAKLCGFKIDIKSVEVNEEVEE